MKNFFLLSVLSLVCFSQLAFSQTYQRPPQFVVLAFDGSYSIDMWRETREFALQNDVRFTYFVSGVYFLSSGDRRLYNEPRLGRGKSAIGFGGSRNDIAVRIQEMNKAVTEGHEMASHANGHYDGTNYSYSQWDSEFSQFTDFMSNVWKRYGVSGQPSWWMDLFRNKIFGFRAPLLGRGAGMWPALRQHGFQYDTSRISQMNYWPKKVEGLWNFPLAGLRNPETGGTVLSMDYNFYLAQSGARTGPSYRFKYYEDSMYNSYMNYFRSNYNGNRAPIHIGHHFSKWNGGAYWKAFQRFAQSVCKQPEVKCVTYKQLMDYMNSKSSQEIDAFQRGQFVRKGKSGLNYQLMQRLSDKELKDLEKMNIEHFKSHQ